MALFAFWRDTGGDGSPAAHYHLHLHRHRQLREEAHVVPEHVVAHRLDTPGGGWHLAAFSTATRFYSATDQIWNDPAGGACVIHGLVWRQDAGRPRLLDARAVAALLDRPGRTLPDDICGEYAIARLHGCGTLTAFSDRAGLHQLFYDPEVPGIVANRAAFVALLRDDWRSDPANGLWLATIGYRVGETTAHARARMIRQEHRLTIDGSGQRLDPLPDPVVAFPSRSGFADGGSALVDEGIVQARAAILLAAGDDPVVALPITGGKDSRAVLALCLAAGLRGRLRLFTRGYDGHPDVIAGRAIAAACGLPHERQPPLGSDQAPYWSAATVFDNLAAQAYQTDGMMGGWDFILGRNIGTDTLITGHMGEVLKAYSKRPLADGPLDPVDMVRGQAPFDPLGLLRPNARALLVDELQAQMARAEAGGATRDDQPDIFYYRNRLPNWLGGIRGIKAFERQPVMPLGVPAFMRLAFRMSAQDRRMERVHYEIVRRCAPELIAPAFAIQSWHAALFTHGDVPATADPVLPAASAPPVFGNWQYSLNHVPRVRAAFADLASRRDLALWDGIDRDAVLDRLRYRTFDYFDGISLLGLLAAMFAETGMAAPVKIGAATIAPQPPAASGRPIDPAMRARLDGTDWPLPPVTLHGHVDGVRRQANGAAVIDGWLRAPAFPGARPVVTAQAGDRIVATAVADRTRPDLLRAGIDDGAHGFALPIDDIAAGDLQLIAFDSGGFSPIGGRVRLDP